MSDLVPSLIPLDKGLNLQTAKLVAPVGSVLDTLNYEQVDFQGQKRIDGFVRYDGSVSPALDEYYVINTATSPSAISGSLLVNADGELIGEVVTVLNATRFYAVIINDNLIPAVGDSISVIGNGPVVVSSVVLGKDYADDTDDHYGQLLDLSNTLRQHVTELPGQVIGLHWFRDRLYAVADVTTVSLEGTTPTIYPNDNLVLTGDDTVLKVLDSITLANTRVVFLGKYANDYNFAAWQDSDNAVQRVTVDDDLEDVGNIANGFETLTNGQEVASFFVALSEQQAKDDLDDPYQFGWKFIDQGWIVPFEDGLSLFGSLPSLNQNIIGLGEQGPTSTSGSNGLPLILTQKVTITNEVVQVNGWKSSQTPDTYELETDNLEETGDETIYADAYISWNGTTGEVVGVTSPLVEYIPTNTVVIDPP